MRHSQLNAQHRYPTYHNWMSHNPYGSESTVESKTILVFKCRVPITESKCQNQTRLLTQKSDKEIKPPTESFPISILSTSLESVRLPSRSWSCPLPLPSFLRTVPSEVSHLTTVEASALLWIHFLIVCHIHVSHVRSPFVTFHQNEASSFINQAAG